MPFMPATLPFYACYIAIYACSHAIYACSHACYIAILCLLRQKRNKSVISASYLILRLRRCEKRVRMCKKTSTDSPLTSTDASTDLPKTCTMRLRHVYGCAKNVYAAPTRPKPPFPTLFSLPPRSLIYRAFLTLSC